MNMDDIVIYFQMTEKVAAQHI